jgi:hypothetical protein
MLSALLNHLDKVIALGSLVVISLLTLLLRMKAAKVAELALRLEVIKDAQELAPLDQKLAEVQNEVAKDEAILANLHASADVHKSSDS